jgi:WD40 repeat protein
MPTSKRLVAALTKAARAAFSEVRAAHPDEHFYVFALFSETGDDLQPTCNTEEALARVTRRLRRTKPSDLEELRYFAEEFAYHQAGEEHFAAIDAISETPGDDDRAAATAALRELEREGFFGRGKARRDVAVLVLLSDQSNENVLEHARQLNPKPVVLGLRRFFPVREPTRDRFTTIGKEKVYAIDGLALSGDGERLAAAGGFGGDGVFVWRLGKTPALLFRDACEGDSVWSVALTRDGARLYGKGKTSIRRWDVATKKALPPLPVRGTALPAFALSPDDSVVAYASYRGLSKKPWAKDMRVTLLDAASGAERATVEAEASFLRFSPDGRHLAYCGRAAGIAKAPQGIVLVDARTLAPVRVLSAKGARFWCLAFSPSSDVVAGVIEGEASGICIFGTRDGKIRRRIGDYAGRASRVAFSPDGKHMAAALANGSVRVWDVATGASRLDARAKHENLGDVLFLDARRVAAGGVDVNGGPPVTVWQLASNVRR